MEFVAKKFSENSRSKILRPGTHYARIVDIRIDVPAYNKDAMSLVFILEGPELPDFVGAVKNKLNPSEGNYKGQIAYVKSGKYPFSEYTYKGNVYPRDPQIFRFINNLAQGLGVLDKMVEDGIGGETIEEYIYNASKYIIDEELYAYFTIGGKEEKSAEYGLNYRMYFPKSEKTSSGVYLQPFFKAEAGLKDEHLKDNMIIFDDAKHIERDAVVESSALEEKSASMGSGLIYTSSSAPTITLGAHKSSFTL